MWTLYSFKRLLPSVGVEDSLVGGDGLARSAQFVGRRPVGIANRRQTPEFHQAGHEQHARLRRAEIGAGDEIVMRIGEAFGRPASDARDRNTAVDRLLHDLLAYR